MNFQPLQTERLHLVQITEAYIDSYYDIMSREKVMKYYGMEPMTSRSQAVKILESMKDTFHREKGIRWGIIDLQSDRFIGTVGLNNLSIGAGRAEVGYELHPEFWQRGLATEAVNAVLDYAFQHLELFRVGAVTFPENEGSSKLLRKIGFKQEGILRGYLYQKNQNHDALLFSILLPEYQKVGRNEG
ncbi:GNAT family N-acetyltransferase [Halobacillus litoralis]|uniref:GNAT family N-acetyltransferase n=1 Tax=Halobacillus litoralis TaxID=45668 RepID=UPI001CFEBAF2|nr:GNAT family N-acetyltransferase [Halobacillus litoralis]